MIHVTNPHKHTYTLDSSLAVANFKGMTLQQAANTKPVPHAQVLLLNTHPKKCEHTLSQLLDNQTETDVKRWYPASKTSDDEDRETHPRRYRHSLMQRAIELDKNR